MFQKHHKGIIPYISEDKDGEHKIGRSYKLMLLEVRISHEGYIGSDDKERVFDPLDGPIS